MLTGPATVQAVGMWGVPPQPTSYPSGFGFTPSSAVSVAYTGGVTPTLTSCAQTNSGSLHSLLVGQQVQQVLQCFYASVPATTTCSPGTDAYGNTATFWGTSNGDISIGLIGSGNPGQVTAVSAGTVNATAKVGATTCNPWTFTVTAPPPPVMTISGPAQMSGGTALIP